MTRRRSDDPDRLSQAEAERLLNGELSTGPIAALLRAAAGPARMPEQASEFVARSAFRSGDAPTEPVPVVGSERHAVAGPPSRSGRVFVAAAVLSRLLSPRVLVGAIAGVAAVGVLVTAYTGSLQQSVLPDAARAPAASAPAQPPGAQQIPPAESVLAPPPAAPGQAAAGPTPAAPPASVRTPSRAATRPGAPPAAAVPVRSSEGGSAADGSRSGASSDSSGSSGGSADSTSSGSAGSSGSTSSGSDDGGSSGSSGGGSSGGQLLEVNVLGIELGL